MLLGYSFWSYLWTPGMVLDYMCCRAWADWCTSKYVQSQLGASAPCFWNKISNIYLNIHIYFSIFGVNRREEGDVRTTGNVKLFYQLFSALMQLFFFLLCCIKSGRPVEHHSPGNAKIAFLAATLLLQHLTHNWDLAGAFTIITVLFASQIMRCIFQRLMHYIVTS